MFSRLTEDERILKQDGMSRAEVLMRRQYAADELERLDAGAPVEDIYYQRALDSLPGAYDIDEFPSRYERLITALGLTGSAGTLVQGVDHTDGTKSYNIVTGASTSRGYNFLSYVFNKKQQPDSKFIKGQRTRAVGACYNLDGGYQVDAFGDGNFNRRLHDLPAKYRVGNGELIHTFFYDIYLEWYKATRVARHGQGLSQLSPRRRNIVATEYEYEAGAMYDRGAKPIGDERHLMLMAEVAARSVLELNPALPKV